MISLPRDDDPMLREAWKTFVALSGYKKSLWPTKIANATSLYSLLEFDISQSTLRSNPLRLNLAYYPSNCLLKYQS